MDVSPKKRQPTTYVFVDAANIIYRDSEPNPWKIDLKKLIKYLQERFSASKVFYFGGLDDRNRTQIHIYKKLEEWGYELHLNPVKRFVNERGEWYLKADVDARMAFKAMHCQDEYDRAVFMTGDGDFFWLLEHLVQKKERIWLLASPKKTAKELKKLFGANFANLDNLRSLLEYPETLKETDSTNDSVSGVTRPV